MNKNAQLLIYLCLRFVDVSERLISLGCQTWRFCNDFDKAVLILLQSIIWQQDVFVCYLQNVVVLCCFHCILDRTMVTAQVVSTWIFTDL